jgi:hypothetical protein
MAHMGCPDRRIERDLIRLGIPVMADRHSI